jgi:hypothetical protein
VRGKSPNWLTLNPALLSIVTLIQFVAGVLGLVWAVMWDWRDIGFDGSTVTVPLCGQVCMRAQTNIETIGCSTNSVILARTFYTVNIH